MLYAKLSHVMKDSARYYHKRTWVLHEKFPIFVSGFKEA